MDILKHLDLNNLSNFDFGNFDFSKLKLPIEPKQLIILYLCYKLINNLDRIDFNSLFNNTPIIPVTRIIPKRLDTSYLYIIFITGIIGFFIMNTIIDNIDVSVKSYNLNNINRNPLNCCPLFNNMNVMKDIEKCPIFKNKDIEKCPIFKNKDIEKCPIFKNKDIEKCQYLNNTCKK